MPQEKKLSPKQQAIANGDTHYKGAPCSRCGHVLRYTVSSSCVDCNKKRAMGKEIPKKQKQFIANNNTSTRDETGTTQEDINFADVIRKVYGRNQRW